MKINVYNAHRLKELIRSLDKVIEMYGDLLSDFIGFDEKYLNDKIEDIKEELKNWHPDIIGLKENTTYYYANKKEHKFYKISEVNLGMKTCKAVRLWLGDEYCKMTTKEERVSYDLEYLTTRIIGKELIQIQESEWLEVEEIFNKIDEIKKRM